LMNSVGWSGINLSILPIVALVATLILLLPSLGRKAGKSA